MDSVETGCIRLYLLGQTRAVLQAPAGGDQVPLSIQPKPLRLLAYLVLHREQAHRREHLRALFWPDHAPRQAANNLRQALWHLRRALPLDTLLLEGDAVWWNPERALWIDVLAFEAALDAGDWDAALGLYRGPLLVDDDGEWVLLERERLQLRYLTALEARAQQRYKTRCWEYSLEDAEALLSADPLNEAAVRLALACHWATGQREAARRRYEAFRRRLRQELNCDPLPETVTLCQRILRGEPHPDQGPPPADASLAAQRAHLSLLEMLGAFRKGLDRARAWALEADGPSLVEARRWEGRFLLRLGQLADARVALEDTLPLADAHDLRAAVLGDLAETEMALSDYAAAETHYEQALALTADVSVDLLSSLGNLRRRMGRCADARRTLEEAARLARSQDDPAALAVACSNLGIALIGQGENEAAEVALQEALAAAQRADAHWLIGHVTGYLGLVAHERQDLETALQHYERARTLTGTFGAQRSAILWTLNQGIVRYEQGSWDEALSLLAQGLEEAVAQGSRNLESGATIFVGACLVARGDGEEGLAKIEQGLALALDLGDQERILIGYLHRGRALIALARYGEARQVLEEGLLVAESSGLARLGRRLRSELETMPPAEGAAAS